MPSYIPYSIVKKIMNEMPKKYVEKLMRETLREDEIEELIKATIQEEDIPLLTFLFDAGANVNRKIDVQGSYLGFAIREGKEKAAEVLIEKGIAFKNLGDIAYADIIYAVQCENLEIFNYLVKKGADVNAEETRNETIDVFTFVREYHQKEFLNYMLTIKELFSEEKQKELEKLKLRILLYR